jgi:Na+/proline symporter
MLISYFTSRKGSDNEAFFLGNRKSTWYVVAFGMVGTSLSGVTFISVPGMVRNADMTYMQMVLGFFVGYIVIAYILLPLYYRLNLTTIYGYLGQRFGAKSHKTGASFFLLSKTIGAAVRLYLVAIILQRLVFDTWNVPFVITVIGIIVLIWGYTARSGIKTIVWTDALQTFVLIAALLLIIVGIMSNMGLNIGETAQVIRDNGYSRIFVFNDWHSTQNFFKLFFSGIFITIVMNGLDQDMMQKNLSCKNLKDAQKNMISYGLAFTPVTLLFLVLGALLLVYAGQHQITLPAVSDEILPMITSQHLGGWAFGLFIIGIIAASFSSADSALTALTTSFCVDILGVEKAKMTEAVKTRRIVHIGISAMLVVIILIIQAIATDSVIHAIYKVASYTYGPLLGLYLFGLYSKVKPTDKYVPYVAILAPILCLATEIALKQGLNYQIGFELLILNALLTGLGLFLIRSNQQLKIGVSQIIKSTNQQ